MPKAQSSTFRCRYCGTQFADFSLQMAFHPGCLEKSNLDNHVRPDLDRYRGIFTTWDLLDGATYHD